MEQIEQPSRSWRAAVRGNVLMMGLVSLFTDLSSEMMNPLLPIFLVGVVPLGLDKVYLGLMEGVAETTASLLKLFSGRISDRLGKRKALVVAGYGISAVARPLMSLAVHGLQVVGLKFIDRVGKGIRTSPRDALIGDSVGPQVRGLAFSFHRAMDHTGAVLGSVASAGILFAMLGYGLWHGSTAAPTGREMHALRWLFGLALVPGAVAMIALVGKVREIAPKPAAAPAGGAAGPVGQSVWKRLPGRFYCFVGIVGLFALGNSSDLFLLMLARDRFQMALGWIIGLWVALHLSKIVFSFPGGILSDLFGRRPTIIIGWLVYALVYLGMAHVEAQWEFWALFLAYGFYYGMTEGAEKAMVADFVGSEHRGTAYGIYHAAIGIAALPASLMFGVFWAKIGPKVAFSIGAALAGAAAVLLAVLVSTGGKQARNN